MELNPRAGYGKGNPLPSLGQIFITVLAVDFLPQDIVGLYPQLFPHRAPRLNFPLPDTITFFSRRVFLRHCSLIQIVFISLCYFKFILIGLDFGKSKRHYYYTIFRLSLQFPVPVINKGELWFPPSPRAQAQITTMWVGSPNTLFDSDGVILKLL